MHLDPALALLVGICFAVLLIGLVLDYLRQPLVLAYLVVGVLLGPDVFGFVESGGALGPLGELGIMLLLFFVGMEVSPRELMKSWRVAVFGTLAQVLVSVGAVWLIGSFLDWPLPRTILLGFVISLSSTAVVVKLLQDAGELNTDTGRDTLGILLVQDLLIVPMMLILVALGDPPEDAPHAPIALQVVGAIGIFAFVIWVIRRGRVNLPLANYLRDHEIEVFAALAICFGFALATALLGLSAVLGAFVAGIFVAAARETEWFHENLQPFHVLLVAFFFLSVGLMLDLDFMLDNLGEVLLLVAAALLTNTFINAVILRLLGEDWRHSLFAGALLSQIGEFSFVLASLGLAAGIIGQQSYQLTISVIALSLLASPPWIGLVRRLVGYQPPDPSSPEPGVP